MTDLTWKYAILQAFKLSQIDYLPGGYNQRLSYIHLNILTYEETVPDTSSRNAITRLNPKSNRKLASDVLGFELPLNKFNLKPITPRLLENIFQKFLSGTAPKHHSQSPETERNLQKLAKLVLDKLDLSESWDAVVMITALTLSRRKPLPMQDDNLRDRQWVDLVTRRKSPSGDMQCNLYGNPAEFCLSFLVTAIVKRYSQFQEEPNSILAALWEKRWGNLKCEFYTKHSEI
jgi:hypothetical protein